MAEPGQAVPGQAASDCFSVKMEKILVPTDFSAKSDRSLSYAMVLAERFQAHLTLMHVLTAVDDLGQPERSSPAYQAQRKAADSAIEGVLGSRRLQGVPHEVLLEEGYLWPTIERFIHDHEIDLVAVGTHGAPKADREFSSAEVILRNVDCPVLLAGPACREPAPEPFARILFATDFGRAAMHSTSFAVGLALAFQAELTLLHVAGARPNSSEERSILCETSRIRMVESVPEEIAPRLKMQTQVEFGETPDRILSVAQDRRASVILMGARAGLTPEVQRLPSLIYGVAVRAACPLITIRR